MLVIHGIWAYGAPHVWAEDPALPALAPPRAGRPSRAPRSHPFAVPPGRLADALAEEAGGYAARWRPVLSAADVQRARELAAAMPPACRAAEGAAEGTAPGPLLAGALDALVDASARARLPGGLLPVRRGRRPARI